MVAQIYTQSPKYDRDDKMNTSTSTATGTGATPNTAETSTDSKSISSRSTRSRGSAVLARAREYNRIIDENRSRSKSREHKPGAGTGNGANSSIASEYQRSASRGRSSHAASAQDYSQWGKNDTKKGAVAATSHSNTAAASNPRISTSTNGNANRYGSASGSNTRQEASPRLDQAPASQGHSNQESRTSDGNTRSSPTQSNKENVQSRSNTHGSSMNRLKSKTKGNATTSGGGHGANGNAEQAIVTPELLVDALSGHEDGLLAIAERLMEHYDAGYDAMGEAIIDAFADVQKLFQHVVEAAHMEGAAYEAGRKEEEIERLKRALGGEGGTGHGHGGDYMDSPPMSRGKHSGGGGHPASPASPLRHEEFIDQDVRDVLSEAIRKGQGMKDARKFADCYQIYEYACNSASALLPVDSDHRGRLQLSIARAESMSPERACAILRYVMDDVLRSGLNSSSKVVMPDPSQRGDCVLSRPPPKSRGDESAVSSRFAGGQGGVSADDSGVLQSSEEALASMVEEMKEILSAPVYDNSPLQNVAERFWAALSEAQRSNLKNEERLEQKLATLKAEFLLAREEWEEKYNILSHKCDTYKRRTERMKQSKYMERARQSVHSLGGEFSSEEDYSSGDGRSTLDSPRSGRAESTVSSYAKSFVGSFSCGGRGRSKARYSNTNTSGSGICSNPRDSSPPSASSSHLRKTLSSNSNFSRSKGSRPNY